AAPSSLADLKVKLVTVGGRDMLNISWKIWFHFLVKASHGFCDIQAANLPLPPLGSDDPDKYATIVIPRPKGKVFFILFIYILSKSKGMEDFFDVIVAVFGSLAGLAILSSCYLIYKNYRSNVAASLGFQNLPDAVPVPVLVVYPAENSAFQRAVVALAEFLQWHGGCSVAFDMWHQGKVAELGPMRWLAEQVKAADRVLIICPGVETTVQCPPHHSFPEPSIPAAARDLYPLILNMVASHAKSAGELAKFWVVQLGERQDKKPSTLAPELRTCRTFRVMKDLKKLCEGLHDARQSDRKISDLLLRPGFSYSEKSAKKLKEAVEMLRGNQTSSSKETQPLRSVISSV
uniref:SEFIR domain-containing protein n=1 Tax=Acanthochromis polyacanthus TaxID=80966 RepID=A0A3Q1EZ08_9TELE